MDCTITKKRLKDKPKTYSVSRLKLYNRCSYEYYHRYINNTEIVKSFSPGALIGSLIHKSLEYLYTIEDDSVERLIDAYRVTFVDTILNSGIFYGNSKEDIKILCSLLVEYAEGISILYERSSAEYKGNDAIRVKSGGIASNPTMTTAWKMAEEENSLDKKREAIDSFIYGRTNIEGGFSTIFADSYFLAKKYKTPHQLREILYIEFPISHWDKENSCLINPINLGRKYNNIYFNGYIDMIAMVEHERDNKLAIIDHKTDKTTYTMDEVECNRQLLIYADMFERLTGKRVDMIGINNIRSSELILVNIDRNIMQESIDSLLSCHPMIKDEHFIKSIPDSAYSPCKDYYGKVCPYLQHCWPKTFEQLNN